MRWASAVCWPRALHLRRSTARGLGKTRHVSSTEASRYEAMSAHLVRARVRVRVRVLRVS